MAPSILEGEEQDWTSGLDDLVRKVSLENEEAFERFCEITKIHLMKVINSRKQFLNVAQAESVYNHVLFKIWTKANTYQGKSKGDSVEDRDRIALGWVSSIAITTTIDAVRKLRRRKEKEIQEADIYMFPADHLSIYDQVASKEGAKEFFDSLTDMQEKVVALLAQGKSQREIAKDVHLSPARVSQIVKDIKELLNNTMRW